MKRKLFALFLSFVCTVNIAFAVEIPESMRETMSKDYGLPGLLHLIVAMAFVIALIYITGWIYAKLNIINRNRIGKIAQKENLSSHFTVLQSMPLGQQRYIYSIEMNDKILLIGSTPSHINLLKEFDKEKVSTVTQNDYDLNNISEETSEKNVSTIDEIYKKYKK